MMFVMLQMFGYWIAMGTVIATLMWSALNFARLCEWILNKITRKTS